LAALGISIQASSDYFRMVGYPEVMALIASFEDYFRVARHPTTIEDWTLPISGKHVATFGG
jgi:hypothetical protein